MSFSTQPAQYVIVRHQHVPTISQVIDGLQRENELYRVANQRLGEFNATAQAQIQALQTQLAAERKGGRTTLANLKKMVNTQIEKLNAQIIDLKSKNRELETKLLDMTKRKTLIVLHQQAPHQ